jgi:trans-aconitate 2-methyltransferase
MSERDTLKVRWDPDQYRRFASHRLRPALDLAARLEGLGPRTIYDLGCGTGEITRMLAARWPHAKVHGVDSSEEMLEKARAQADNVTFERGDLAAWSTASADLLFSNAAYHWIPDHRSVFPRLLESLAPGGALAVQMPMSWDLPSHRAMREVLAAGRGGGGAPFGSAALRGAMDRKPLLDTGEYYRLLAANAKELDVWETEYLQALEGEDPVLEWVRGTGLRPILEGLAGEERDAFVERYRMRLRELYPRGDDGRTLYPFRRLFLYARV